MRRFNSLASRCWVLLFVTLAFQAVSNAQSDQRAVTTEGKIPSLLAEAGYKYVVARGGLWRTSVPRTDKSFLRRDLFVAESPSNRSVRLNLVLGLLDSPADAPELKEKVADLTRRHVAVGFAVTKDAIFVVAEIPEDELDRASLEKAIEKVSAAAALAHPEVAKFIKPDPKESYGPGAGDGLGVGVGRGDTPANAPSGPTTSNSAAATSVDTRPVPLNRVSPAYTEEARMNKVEGTVRLRVLVDVNGKPERVMVVAGLPDGLSEKAIEAGYQLKFKPAMKDGKAVKYWVSIDVNFALR